MKHTHYIQRLEAQDRMEAIESVRRGLESMKRNAGKPAEQFFQEFFAEQGISERESSRASRQEHTPEVANEETQI